MTNAYHHKRNKISTRFYAQLYFFAFLFSIIFHPSNSIAQDCTSLGQNANTAFPVCGTTTFYQGTVGICGNRTIISRCNTGTIYQDKNPYWYKFKCYVSGTLGFIITPNNLNDDYDWQIFDITNRNPEDIYTDLSMFVACNWSGEPGLTGASPAGTSLVNCDGLGIPLFSKMPEIIEGHEYLLLVSHFTNTDSGYGLSFEGGTASVTDPKEPHLLSASASCNGTSVILSLNKQVKCISLDTDGSGFSIQPPIANIVSVSGNGCSNSFDLDTLTITLDKPLTAGAYKIGINNGGDGNTLLDNCDRPIPPGDEISFVVFPPNPTPMDSIKPLGCSPQKIELEFKKPLLCNSIAPDGSDFIINGPYPVSISKAESVCNNNSTNTIILHLQTPMQIGGNFTIKLVRGTDGNTILNNCSQETPEGSTISFIVKDTVNADFQTTVSIGCDRDVIQYAHNGKNDVNSWKWNFDTGESSSQQNPSVIYTRFGDIKTTLIVSNGVCSDTTERTLFLKYKLKAGFESTENVCPDELAYVKDTSYGDVVKWKWELGNGNSSTLPNPPPQGYVHRIETYKTIIKLIVEDNLGCKDTALNAVNIVANCYISIPNAFTPNNDGINDYLYPLNAFNTRDLTFAVFNRFGERVFYTNDWTKKWNGKYKGEPADPGTYVWILNYYDIEKKKTINLKGAVLLIR